MIVSGCREAMIAASLGADYEEFLFSLSTTDFLSFYDKKIAVPLRPVGEVVLGMIVNQTKHDPSKGLEHPGNWATHPDAVAGVEAISYLRDYSNECAGKEFLFFDTMESFQAWKEKAQSEAVYLNIALRYKAYLWDLGPELFETY
jgi:hypothetical protein